MSAGNFAVSIGTLNGVTVTGGDLQVIASLDVLNGLTIVNPTAGQPGNLDMHTGAVVIFDGPSQTVDNLNISGVPGGGYFYIYASGPTSTNSQTLTLGSNLTVHGGALISDAYYSPQTLINNGIINADNNYPSSIDVDNFTNNGTAEATNGDTLYISAANWSNSATGILSASGSNAYTGSTLSLSGAWSNAGTISATNAATLNLGGTYTTAGIGNLTASPDSTVNITGSQDNTGATFSPGSYGGTWYLTGGGVITNGTINLTGGNFNVTYGTLNGVTATSGNLQINNTLNVSNGLTMSNGGVLCGNGTVTGSTTIASGGTVTGGSGATPGNTYGTVTLGAGATFQSGGSYVWKLNLAPSATYATTPTVNSATSSPNNMDALIMSALTNSATSGSPFNINLITQGTSTLAPYTAYKFAIANVSNGDNSTFADLSEYKYSGFMLSEEADSMLSAANNGVDAELDGGSGEDLILTYTTPEPTSLLLGGLAIAPLLMARRRRGALSQEGISG